MQQQQPQQPPQQQSSQQQARQSPAPPKRQSMSQLYAYQKLIFRLLFVLAKRLSKVYANEDVKEAQFKRSVEEILSEMQKCEQSVQLAFKYSYALQVLRESLKLGQGTVWEEEDDEQQPLDQKQQQRENVKPVSRKSDVGVSTTAAHRSAHAEQQHHQSTIKSNASQGTPDFKQKKQLFRESKTPAPNSRARTNSEQATSLDIARGRFASEANPRKFDLKLASIGNASQVTAVPQHTQDADGANRDVLQKVQQHQSQLQQQHLQYVQSQQQQQQQSSLQRRFPAARVNDLSPGRFPEYNSRTSDFQSSASTNFYKNLQNENSHRSNTPKQTVAIVHSQYSPGYYPSQTPVSYTQTPPCTSFSMSQQHTRHASGGSAKMSVPSAPVHLDQGQLTVMRLITDMQSSFNSKYGSVHYEPQDRTVFGTKMEYKINHESRRFLNDLLLSDQVVAHAQNHVYGDADETGRSVFYGV